MDFDIENKHKLAMKIKLQSYKTIILLIYSFIKIK